MPGLTSGDARCSRTISRHRQNLHDALAIHRGEHQTIRWQSAAKPDEIRQSRSS